MRPLQFSYQALLSMDDAIIYLGSHTSPGEAGGEHSEQSTYRGSRLSPQSRGADQGEEGGRVQWHGGGLCQMVHLQENHLQLNIGKTKELVVDFRLSRKPPAPITIQGVEI